MFYQVFVSPQVKRWAIITYKNGIYELPNDLTLRNLGNKEISGNCLNPIEREPSDQSPRQYESPATPNENQSQPQIPRKPLHHGTITTATPKQ